MAEPGLFLVAGFVGVALIADAFRARSVREWRARTSELLARTMRWEAPLVPVLGRAAEAASGRARRLTQRLRAELESGASLAGACARCGRRVFPRACVAEIRAAEGTSGLADVLEAQAERAHDAGGLRPKILRAALYPLVLAAFLHTVLGPATSTIAEVADSLDRAPTRLHVAGRDLFHGALAASVLLLLGSAIAARLGRSPGARLARAAALLRPLGALLRAGVALPEALRRCDRLRAAAAVEDGRSWPEAAALLGLPRGILDRAALRDPGPHLCDLADECERRRARRTSRIGFWILPGTVAAMGVFVLLQYAALATLLRDVFTGVQPW